MKQARLLRLPRFPLVLVLIFVLVEALLFAFTHGPARASVAVVSGGGGGGGEGLGWLVVGAHMASVLVMPVLILTCALACSMHLLANRPFQRLPCIR